MPNRILRDGILTSERVNRIAGNPATEVFYRRLHSVADDFGRYPADPRIIRAACYPLMLDHIRDADVIHWLDECASAGLLVLYSAGAKKYLQLNDFNQRTRAQKSKYPAPPVGIGSPQDASECHTHDGVARADDRHMTAACRSYAHGDGDGDEIPPKPPAAKTAAESVPVSESASNGKQAELNTEAENVYDVAAETFDLSDQEREEAAQTSPNAPKSSLLNPEVETVIDVVGRRIHGRHPVIRRCGLVEAKKHLQTIARRAPAKNRAEMLHRIDQNHAGWCATDGWSKDGGKYAKGLDNWLAPTKERYLEAPPSTPSGNSDEVNEYGYPRLMM